jgi:hypothetical protein
VRQLVLHPQPRQRLIFLFQGQYKLAWSQELLMTIVLLASVSLFALVVTSRPILSDADRNNL